MIPRPPNRPNFAWDVPQTVQNELKDACLVMSLIFGFQGDLMPLESTYYIELDLVLHICIAMGDMS